MFRLFFPSKKVRKEKSRATEDGRLWLDTTKVRGAVGGVRRVNGGGEGQEGSDKNRRVEKKQPYSLPQPKSAIAKSIPSVPRTELCDKRKLENEKVKHIIWKARGGRSREVRHGYVDIVLRPWGEG